MANVCLIGTLENVILLAVLCKYSVLRSRTNTILASLVTSDFLTATVLAPLHAVQLLSDDMLHQFSLDQLRRYLSILLIGASTFTLGFISYDRCLHLLKLHNYNLRRSTLYSVLCVCWLLPVFLPLLRLVDDKEKLYSSVVVLLGLIVLVEIVVAYVILLVVLTRHKQRCCKVLGQQFRMQKERYTGVTVVITVTFYLTMLLPIIATLTMTAAGFTDKSVLCRNYVISMCLAISNSVINPVIYCYRTAAFRKHVKKLTKVWLRKFHQDKQMETLILSIHGR